MIRPPTSRTPRLLPWIFLLTLAFPGAAALGQIVPLGDPFQVNEDTRGTHERPASCGDGRGGYAISWTQDLGSLGMQVAARRFGADGGPVGGDLVAAQGADPVLASAIGCLPGGGLVVAWVRDTGEYGRSEIMARRFGASGAALGPPFPVSTGSGWDLRPSIACSGAGCTVVWTREHFDQSTTDVLFRRLDAAGMPAGPETSVLEMPDSYSPSGTVAMGPSGEFAVVWARRYLGDVLTRRFDAAGTPAGPVVEVRPAGSEYVEIATAVAALDAQGNLAVAWPELNNHASVPIDSVFLSVLDSEDRPIRDRVRIEDRPYQQWTPELTLDAAGSFVAVWSSNLPSGDALLGRVFDGRGEPLGPPEVLVVKPWAHPADPSAFHAAAGTDGSFLLTWVDRSEETYSLEIFAGLFRSGVPGPPSGPWLSSSAVPGFEFKVRITGGAGPIVGVQEASCIPETVCVSGALAGRSEVFLRVVGPKPNGRMWPTLVKFSTSTVEVWVRQNGSGELRYYRLEGARPGLDELPGLFDRTGFLPVAVASSRSGLTLAEPRPLDGTQPAPSTGVFTSEHYPDFRFRARISSGDQVQEVRKESACIDETLCLSGAIPGRSEVFLRIVGPKPNGRLWPTLVKFTTSTLEVWIEQVATGEERYYRIEGAAPGHDDLTGLFDREGFEK